MSDAPRPQGLGPASTTLWHQDATIPSHGEVWVFGSNLAGRHGAGAARVAIERFGARYGQGTGYQGQAPRHCFAIPTKDERIRTLPLEVIRQHIEAFIDFAKRSHHRFFLTRVGCGLAGYTDEQIAPLFAAIPLNRCSIPEAWRPWLPSIPMAEPSETYPGPRHA